MGEKEILKIEPKKKYITFSKRNTLIRKDVVFKIIMSKKENGKYLKEFLEAILHKSVDEIIEIYAEKLLEKDYKNLKDMKLDLLVKFDKDELVDIEIQNSVEKNIFERSLAYSSRLLYNDYNRKDKYVKGKKKIIWIMDFNLPIKSKEYHEIYSYKNKDGSDEKNFIEHHFIQLPKFIKNIKEIKTEEEKWLAYFSGQLNKKEEEELLKMSRTIKEVNEIVDIVMTDPEVRAVLNAKEARKMERFFDKKAGYDEGIEQGIEQGLEQGINTRNKEIVNKMLEEKMDFDFIIKITGLTKEEIEKLKKAG